jgi:hypothetical protein
MEERNSVELKVKIDLELANKDEVYAYIARVQELVDELSYLLRSAPPLKFAPRNPTRDKDGRDMSRSM